MPALRYNPLALPPPLMIDRCRSALLVAAAAYLALLPSNALSFWRSLAFATGAISAIALLVAYSRDRGLVLPSPGRAVLLTLAAWASWAVASLAWSIDPAFTASELKSDVLWGVLTLLMFYVAATQARGWQVMVAAVLAGVAFWPALALGLSLSSAGWNARLAHMGVVAYSTYLVTVAPMLLVLLWPAPIGFASGWRSVAVALLLFALVLVTARLSDNRIVWIALAASVVVLVAALRPALSAGRIAIAGGAVILLFALLFADAASDRAATRFGPQASVVDTFAADPRLSIWKHATTHIAQRPWQGYGYGRLIMKEELRDDTGNYLLTHAHNTFVSQWLQTGGIGVALLIAMLVALGTRYFSYLRTGEPDLVRFGALGLAVLVGFVVKNLTDDFFFRANLKVFFAVHAILLGAAALQSTRRSRSPAPRTG